MLLMLRGTGLDDDWETMGSWFNDSDASTSVTALEPEATLDRE